MIDDLRDLAARWRGRAIHNDDLRMKCAKELDAVIGDVGAEPTDPLVQSRLILALIHPRLLKILTDEQAIQWEGNVSALNRTLHISIEDKSE